MSNAPTLSLRDFESFGDVAAEEDAVLEYFLATSAVGTIESGKAFLALGRKGTEKTALVRYFTERNDEGLSKPLNLREYPWSVHAKRIDYGASSIEAYVSSWRYLISVQLATLVLSQTKYLHSDDARALLEFLTDNYGSSNPQLSDIIRPKRLKLTALSLKPAVMGNQLGGVDLDRSKKDHDFGVEINALSDAIMKSVIIVARMAGVSSLNLHFDELDQGLSHLDDEKKSMLVGLVLAAREVRREASKEQFDINPIVYVRSDIWEELQFSDKNKISQSLTFNITWNSDSLLALVDARLRAKLGGNESWRTIAEPALMRGSQPKWNHILARTFLRPRDIISFLNIILKEAKKRSENPLLINNKDIVSSRDEYSAYLKSELDDEIGPHWPHWDEALKACSAVSTITFEKNEFITQYNSRKSKHNDVTADEALALLYRFSVIGYERRSGYGGSGWAFQYTDPEAGWDNSATRFKVHLGLKEYAKLREARAG